MNSVDVLCVNACISVGMCFIFFAILQQMMYICYINTNKTTISWLNLVWFSCLHFMGTFENFGLCT